LEIIKYYAKVRIFICIASLNKAIERKKFKNQEAFHKMKHGQGHRTALIAEVQDEDTLFEEGTEIAEPDPPESEEIELVEELLTLLSLSL